MGRDYNTFIHETAAMIMYHAAPKGITPDCQGSGDCTRAVQLIRRMPASMRRTMMIKWFHDYTPIRIKLSDNGDKCEFDPKYKKLSKEEKVTWWKVEEAAATPFYDLAEATPEEKTYSFEDLIKMVERLGKQIEKKVENGEVKPEDVMSAKALATTVASLKVNRVNSEVKKEANDVTVDGTTLPVGQAA